MTNGPLLRLGLFVLFWIGLSSTYSGTPFKDLTIPGRIYFRDYDLGGPAVAFCHAPKVMTPAECAKGIKLDDWCCTRVRCDECLSPACPPYRANADNAGLSHMNDGEPDQDPSGKLISPQEAYISYTNTGEWLMFTINVSVAGTYNISGMTAAPRPDQSPNPLISFDFGQGVTTGVFTVPPSVCDPGARCTEGYHVWQMNSNMAQVMVPKAGVYVMKFTLEKSYFNPLYFEFKLI